MMQALIVLVFMLFAMVGSARADSTINNLGAATQLNGNELIPMFQGANPAVQSSVNALFVGEVNIKRYGAIGDNSSHPLSSVYGSLAAAQAVYPNASDLTQEIDTMAIQAAIDACAVNFKNNGGQCRRIICPPGSYRISQPIFLDFPNNLRGSSPAWNAGVTYGLFVFNNNGNNVTNLGCSTSGTITCVTYNGVQWASTTAGNTNHIPAVGSAFWIPQTWQSTNGSWSPAFDGGAGMKGGSPPSGCVFAVNSNFTTPVGATGQSFNGTPVFWSVGNGVLVRGVDIETPTPSTQTCANLPGSVGFAIAGAGTRIKFEHVGVNGFYIGIKSAADSVDKTDDLTEVMKSSLIGQCIGVWYSGTQSFMNNMVDDEVRAHVGILSTVSAGVTVYAGNYSGIGTSGGQTAPLNTFTMSNTFPASCGGTATACITQPNNQFQVIVTLTGGTPSAATDPYLSSNQCGLTRANSPLQTLNSALYPGGLDGCVYNAWSFVSPHFGVIPLTLNAYNPATQQATFQIYAAYLWLESNSWGGSGLIDELRNNIGGGTVYAAELQTSFWGCGLTIDGPHIENAFIATRFIRSGCSAGTGRPNHIRQPFFNYDISILGNFNSGGQAAFYAMQGFPFIDMSSGNTNDLVIEDVNYQPGGIFSGQNLITNDNVYVDMISNGGGSATGNGNLIWRGRTFPVNFRVSPPNNSGGNFSADYQGWTSFLGGGFFDDAAAGSANTSASGFGQDGFRNSGISRSPYYGVRPAPWSTPCVTPAEILTFPASEAAVSPSLGSYPILWGDQIYRKCAWGLNQNAGGAVTTFHLRSNHYAWSYGRDITTTDFPGMAWTIQQRSPMVYFNSNNNAPGNSANPVSFLFPGLAATFVGTTQCQSFVSSNPNPNVPANAPFVLITEVHQFLRYAVMTEIRIPEPGGHGNGPPTQNNCNGSTISQQAYSLSNF